MCTVSIPTLRLRILSFKKMAVQYISFLHFFRFLLIFGTCTLLAACGGGSSGGGVNNSGGNGGAGSKITRVSVASDGTQANNSGVFSGFNYYNSLSINSDGRFVAFTSYSSNLVAIDTNLNGDVFIHDTQTATTTLVSISSDGTQAFGGVFGTDVSADGRYVTFSSNQDIFVHDTQSGTTTRVNVASDGARDNSTSFENYAPVINGNGRYVAFTSMGSNLVATDTNGREDVFVHNTQTGITTRVSVSSDGTQANNWSEAPAISADGRYVAFLSYASNLVTGDTNDTCYNDSSGTFIDNCADVFLHDMQTGVTTRVSVASNGAQANSYSSGFFSAPSISNNGQYIAFFSAAYNLVESDTGGQFDVFVHNTQSAVTKRISVASDGTEGNGYSSQPSISGDGRYVAFTSNASNLVTGDSENGEIDIFIHNTQTGETTSLSVESDGTSGNSGSWYPSISEDGRYIAFGSWATNLVADDSNGENDIFRVLNPLYAAP